MVQQVLQPFSFRFSLPQPTPLPTGHSLSTPPLDESIEPSSPYLELLGCLICEAEIYAGAMTAEELRWLTYLQTNLAGGMTGRGGGKRKGGGGRVAELARAAVGARARVRAAAGVCGLECMHLWRVRTLVVASTYAGADLRMRCSGRTDDGVARRACDGPLAFAVAAVALSPMTSTMTGAIEAVTEPMGLAIAQLAAATGSSGMGDSFAICSASGGVIEEAYAAPSAHPTASTIPTTSTAATTASTPAAITTTTTPASATPTTPTPFSPATAAPPTRPVNVQREWQRPARQTSSAAIAPDSDSATVIVTEVDESSSAASAKKRHFMQCVLPFGTLPEKLIPPLPPVEAPAPVSCEHTKAEKADSKDLKAQQLYIAQWLPKFDWLLLNKNNDGLPILRCYHDALITMFPKLVGFFAEEGVTDNPLQSYRVYITR
ncbi:unnamed protein product [Closterium sp. NIES-54]